MAHAKLLARITARPDVFGGKPIVRDMRISVELILSLLAQGHDVVFADSIGADPGDGALLGMAAAEGRVVVTIDMDFVSWCSCMARPKVSGHIDAESTQFGSVLALAPSDAVRGRGSPARCRSR